MIKKEWHQQQQQMRISFFVIYPPQNNFKITVEVELFHTPITQITSQKFIVQEDYTLAEDLANLYEAANTHDMELRVGNAIFGAHKLVLAGTVIAK